MRPRRDEFAALELQWRIRNAMLAELLRQSLDRRSVTEIARLTAQATKEPDTPGAGSNE
jgi:hypothetical protein